MEYHSNIFGIKKRCKALCLRPYRLPRVHEAMFKGGVKRLVSLLVLKEANDPKRKLQYTEFFCLDVVFSLDISTVCILTPLLPWTVVQFVNHYQRFINGFSTVYILAVKIKIIRGGNDQQSKEVRNWFSYEQRKEEKFN